MGHDLRVVAFSWQWSPRQRKWLRGLFRKCLQCETMYVDELYYVLEGYPMCMHCLSQNVVIDRLSDPVAGTCRDCGRKTVILPPEEPETAGV